jgi:REP element-mobilizing transposase RayT
MAFPRKTIRLPRPDYLGCRRYFVTLCCFERRAVFLDEELCAEFLSALATESLHQEFAVLAYCLMPDHVHLLAQGLEASSGLSRFVRAVKQNSGFHLKRKTRSAIWQRFFHDHILRPGESSDAVAWYIWMNPVRVGICGNFRDYRHSGSLTGLWPPGGAPSELWVPGKANPGVAT